MVTLISQNLNEFELHLRAVLGLPIPNIEQLGASASAVILASEKSESISFEGVAEALAQKDVDIKLFYPCHFVSDFAILCAAHDI